MDALTLSATRNPREFRTDDGRLVCPPDGWDCLPPGDAGLTRRVKSLGPTWAVVERRGRKTFSRGVWAPAENIALARRQIESERSDPSYARKLEAGARRREAAQ